MDRTRGRERVNEIGHVSTNETQLESCTLIDERSIVLSPQSYRLVLAPRTPLQFIHTKARERVIAATRSMLLVAVLRGLSIPLTQISTRVHVQLPLEACMNDNK